MCLEAGGIAWRTRRDRWLEDANIAKAGWEDRNEIPKGFSGGGEFKQCGSQPEEVVVVMV